MNSSVAHGRDLVGGLGRWLVVTGLAVSAAAITGCTTSTSGPSDGRRDIATESDQTDAHRRARIRLELAVGYFEQGQTNVALDELKLALAADPVYADAYNLRGLIYMQLKDMGLAEDSFKRAMSLAPRESDILHNYAWMLCQQRRFTESEQMFNQAVANPQYAGQAKTYMALGLCQLQAGRRAEAEKSLAHSYELNPGNPITGYHLSKLLYERKDLTRAQFYIRRLNNSELASAESLWLGVKVERTMGNREAQAQLGSQLKRRFPTSKEAGLFDRGAFDE
ncbi:type IV pilus biogenesis/stability protein PilW [Variovorax sp. VNK109]|jgi:type IV pilus assembly protein PilF|uniref:type IV pilus biogenesis/stability protein PilW n=1 Tax=Variovorax sp. VNK109 TaxID=3400919 RepID=UPI003C106AFB